MAYPETLTANQQTTILAFMPLLRANLLKFAQLTNDFNLLNQTWTNGGVSAINALLQSGDIIPDSTGLNGATPLSAADLTTAMAAVQAYLTSYNTPAYEAYFVRAVGPANAAST